MAESKNRNITVVSKTEKTFTNGNRYMILETVPEAGKKYGDRFQVFEKKVSGETSNAWRQLDKVKANELVGVLYNEKQREYTTPQGIKKTTTDRVITNFSPPTDEGFQFKGAEKPTVKEEINWDKIAKGKVRHGFALEAFKLGEILCQKTAENINAWVDYVMTGKLPQGIKEAEEINRQLDIETPPVEDDKDGVDISEIPF